MVQLAVGLQRGADAAARPGTGVRLALHPWPKIRDTKRRHVATLPHMPRCPVKQVLSSVRLLLKRCQQLGDSGLCYSSQVRTHVAPGSRAWADCFAHVQVLLQPFHIDRKGEIPAGQRPTYAMRLFSWQVQPPDADPDPDHRNIVPALQTHEPGLYCTLSTQRWRNDWLQARSTPRPRCHRKVVITARHR